MNKLHGLWHRLTAPHAPGETEAQQEYMVKVILVILCAVMLFFSPLLMGGWLADALPVTIVVEMLLIAALFGIGYLLAYRGYWRISSYIPTIIFLLSALYVSYTKGIGSTDTLYCTIAILLTVLIPTGKAKWGILILIIAAYLGLGWVYIQGNLYPIPIRQTRTIAQLISIFGLLVIIILLLQFFISQFQNALEQSRVYAAELETHKGNLEQTVNERTAKLKATNEQLEQEIAERAQLQQQIIAAQQQVIRDLSAPIIPVTEQIIVMPLIGIIDTLRARDITRSLLTGISAYRAKVVILDITGVPVVDSGIAAHLDKTIQAARLKGARVIITGISDAVAEAIVDLGIDWRGIETRRDLQTGLLVALNSMGIGMIKK